jgi:hypothetical protein
VVTRRGWVWAGVVVVVVAAAATVGVLLGTRSTSGPSSHSGLVYSSGTPGGVIPTESPPPPGTIMFYQSEHFIYTPADGGPRRSGYLVGGQVTTVPVGTTVVVRTQVAQKRVRTTNSRILQVVTTTQVAGTRLRDTTFHAVHTGTANLIYPGMAYCPARAACVQPRPFIFRVE